MVEKIDYHRFKSDHLIYAANEALRSYVRLFGKEQAISQKNYSLPDQYYLRKKHPKAKKY